MIAEGGFDARASRLTEVPADWNKRVGEFIDLNSPEHRQGAAHYPIVDPNAQGRVEGFQPDDRDGVAMPVRWIYVLSDGTLTGASYVANGRVSVAAATADNPIMGRIAFWTDDETAKVDINTASEGVFWDTPRTQSAEDGSLATNQPVQAEFQRFPGHPATVCLSTVFPDLVSASGSAHNSEIYALSPCIGTGGSQEGTVKTATAMIPQVAISSSRLYANPDEMLYTTTRSTHDGITSDQIDQSRFFLTEASCSPELNLFNRPRVCLWPIPSDVNRRSATDLLMALCSTISGAKNAVLYFTRQDPKNMINDYANDSLKENMALRTAIKF
jgi:uncharacterized protein (TIGR02600 family)